MALQYWHQSTLIKRLEFFCVVICVYTILCLFWFEQLDSSNKALRLLSYHNLALEAHEWGIKPSASNRTRSRLLIYNRVPKCASSTLWKLLQSLQRKHNLQYHHSDLIRHKQLTMQQEKDFLKWLTVTKNAKKRFLLLWIGTCTSLTRRHTV